MNDIRRVSIQDVLRARDERAKRQGALLSMHHSPLISFTMNIAGDVKYSPLICRAFEEGQNRIRRFLKRMKAEEIAFECKADFTGCEALWAVRADAEKLKQNMCLIEESDELGRLFDIDVIAADGTRLSRCGERPCLICGGPVRTCARSRAHSAADLFEKTNQIILHFLAERFFRQTAEMAQKALLYEALTTPKPGLVDCENSGSHRDMDLFSFAASASALRTYFENCTRLGAEGQALPLLQYAGMQAEDDMFAAAGANTHKGAIFSLGILCYAIGSCGENALISSVLDKAAQTGDYFLQQMKSAGHTETGGECQYQRYGLTGARGEAASGFHTVRTIALPVLEKALAKGKTPPEAGLEVLVRLMACVPDSNIIRRAGMEGQKWVMEQAQRITECTPDALRKMNERFVERNISPGGSADLLAATYFLHFLFEGQK